MTSVAVWLGDAAEDREWIELLTPLLPGIEVRLLDVSGTAGVDYAVVWAPPAGALARHPDLKAVVSVGAGVDHLLRDPDLPRHLPILRTTGPDMVQRLREYVALHVLAHHRELMTTDAQQRRSEWRQLVTPVAGRRRVGVMGLGRIGAACAQTLAGLGFDTAGWSRNPHRIDGIATFHGEAGLAEFAARTEILVCLLPLTPETRGILDAGLFASLPEGAAIVNAGRGGHLVDADLLSALAAGRLSAATLDVFQPEPLPADHAFWHHPRIRVTPHIASYIDAATGAAVVAANILAFERDGSAPDVADAGRGY
jgi:glyoxylate/hydroxypyruvate reductase A